MVHSVIRKISDLQLIPSLFFLLSLHHRLIFPPQRGMLMASTITLSFQEIFSSDLQTKDTLCFPEPIRSILHHRFLFFCLCSLITLFCVYYPSSISSHSQITSKSNGSFLRRINSSGSIYHCTFCRLYTVVLIHNP